MPQSNLSFEQRNLLGPVTSTPKNWFLPLGTSLTSLATMKYYSNTHSQTGWRWIYSQICTCEAIRLSDIKNGSDVTTLFSFIQMLKLTLWELCAGTLAHPVTLSLLY